MGRRRLNNASVSQIAIITRGYLVDTLNQNMLIVIIGLGLLPLQDTGSYISVHGDLLRATLFAS